MKIHQLPKIPSFSWSPKKKNPVLINATHLLNTELVVTEKIKGLPICVMNDGLFSPKEPLNNSYDALWRWHKGNYWNVPVDHSLFTVLKDEQLLLIGIRNNKEKMFLSWSETNRIASELELETVPVLECGVYFSEEQLFSGAEKSSTGKLGVVFRSVKKYPNRIFNLKNAQFNSAI